MKQKSILLILAMAAILGAAAFPWLSVILFIFSVSQLVSRIFKLNVILCIFYAVLIFIASIGIVSFIIEAISPSSKQFNSIAILLSISSLLIILWNKRIYSYSSSSLKGSFLSLAAATAAVVFLCIPLLSIEGSSEMVRFLSSGEDNASHFAMFNRNLTTQSPPYLDKVPTGLIESLNIYPQGIQSTAAFLTWTLSERLGYSLGGLLKLYYGIIIIVSALLTFITAEILWTITNKKYRLPALIIGSTACFVGATLFLVGWGFATQIVALAFTLAILYLVLVRNQDLSSVPVTIFLYSALVLGVVFSWYLLLPIVVATIVAQLMYHHRLSFVRSCLLLIPVGILSLLPILLNVLAGKGSGALNEPGGVYVYGIVALTVIGSGLVLYIWTLRWKFAKLPIPVQVFIGFSFGMTSLIAAYQLLTVHGLHYYSFKSLYLIFIVSIFIIAFTLSTLLSKINKSVFAIHAGLYILFTVGYLLASPTYPLVYANNWFNHTLQPQSLDEAVTIRSKSPDTPLDVLYLDNCNPTTAYILNRWTGAIFLTENPHRGKLSAAILQSTLTPKDMEIYRSKQSSIPIIEESCK